MVFVALVRLAQGKETQLYFLSESARRVNEVGRRVVYQFEILSKSGRWLKSFII
jgi:hypothetical protein